MSICASQCRLCNRSKFYLTHIFLGVFPLFDLRNNGNLCRRAYIGDCSNDRYCRGHRCCHSNRATPPSSLDLPNRMSLNSSLSCFLWCLYSTLPLWMKGRPSNRTGKSKETSPTTLTPREVDAAALGKHMRAVGERKSKAMEDPRRAATSKDIELVRRGSPPRRRRRITPTPVGGRSE